MTGKYCHDCKTTKPLGAFYKNRAQRDGHSQYCKPCMSARGKAYAAAHPEKKRATFKAWYAKSADHRTRKAVHNRKGRLKLYYGLTGEAFDRMVHEHGGRCAICRRPETNVRCGKPVPLAVDHNHTTNEVRGLLCTRCNAGLGGFRDDPDILLRAVAYLEGYARPALGLAVNS